MESEYVISLYIIHALLRCNLAERESCFDGMVSTSNHLVPNEQVVYVKTTKPIFWTVELQVDKLK